MKAVAWRVKDFADGWIIFQNEKAAQKEADDTDSDMQALGVLDSIQINEQRIATLEHEKSVAYALQNSYYASLTAAERERDRLSADNKRLREALEVGADMPRGYRRAGTWSEEERKRYFKWDSIVIPLPLTNKHDIFKYADLLAGLVAKLRATASNLELSDREALFDCMMLADETKRKLKEASGQKKKCGDKKS